MGMAVGGSGGSKSVPYINMTPLIDVLLVLLIIFMVITPITPKGLEALVPQPNEGEQQSQPNARTVVVSINADRSIMINRDPSTLDTLEENLRDIFKTRAELRRYACSMAPVIRHAGWPHLRVSTPSP